MESGAGTVNALQVKWFAQKWAWFTLRWYSAGYRYSSCHFNWKCLLSLLCHWNHDRIFLADLHIVISWMFELVNIFQNSHFLSCPFSLSLSISIKQPVSRAITNFNDCGFFEIVIFKWNQWQCDSIDIKLTLMLTLKCQLECFVSIGSKKKNL